MFLKLLIFFAMLFVLSLATYILAIKFKKGKPIIHRIIACISIISLLFTIVFSVLYIKANNIKFTSKINAYDVCAVYTDALAKTTPEDAYKYLPTQVFTQDETSYFINSENDAFSISKSEDIYTAQTVANDVVYLASEKTLKAVITTEGKLILDGHLLYSKYDDAIIQFNNETVAENVANCNFTANSLFYTTKSGELYAIGFNEYGQLGDDTTKNKATPTFVKDKIMKASISDTHSMIIDNYGTLYAVGNNSYSQLGTKNAVSSTELNKIMQGVKDAYAGNYFTLILTVNGELYTAGKNDFGQLGNGGENFKAELIQAMSNVEKIAVNGNTCAALTYDGELFVWGDNTEFKAGCNKGDKITKPTKISENVYDFTLSKVGVTIITKDRDILVSKEGGVFDTAITFTAQVPEVYKERFKTEPIITDEKV